jgi:hypothetical protein
MSLSVVGRYNIAGGATPYGQVQDPNDLDSMYFILSYKLYKFTWPNTLVEIVDLTAYLSGNLYDGAAIANDYSTILGELSADLHYCIFVQPPDAGNYANGTFLDVKLTDASITTYTTLPDYAFSYSYAGAKRTYVAYSTEGTYFYSCHFMNGAGVFLWSRKRLGLSGGETGPVDTSSPGNIFWADYQKFGGYSSPASGNKWRDETISLNATAGYTIAQMIVPGAAWETYVSTHWADHTNGDCPQTFKGWDDNWQYGFGRGIQPGGTGATDLLMYRKNVVTMQYQVVALITDGSVRASDHAENAFDLWQTGDDATKRRIFFSYGYSGGKLFTSLAWPPAVDDSLVIDNAATYIVSLHTANEYVYVIHIGGAQGTCISKVLETELIAGEAEPSIGGIGARLLFKDKRVFFIGVPGYGKYLWWAQPLEPQSLDVGWDGFNSTIFDDEDNTSLNALDDNIYIGSQKGFIRLRGKSPDSWVLDQTLATTGPLSDKTSSVTPFGLIYPRENGLWLFNGFTSTLFFEKGKNLLSNVNWVAYERAFSLWDGRYYRLYYPSGDATENDRELVIDLIGGIENARGTEGDRAATFGFADLTTNTVYLGDASGNLMTLGGTTASRAFSLTTKEYPVAGLLAAGTFSALHYDIDLAGATLSIIPICDGVEKPAKTITNTTRTRSKVSLPDGNYYRIGFRFEVTTDKAVKFYDPWYIV